jgi:5-methylcytosine-specific restriction endonuclease McrA
MGREADRKRRRAQGVPERPHYTPEERRLKHLSYYHAKYKFDEERMQRMREYSKVRSKTLRELDGDAARAADRARYERDREGRITQSIKMRAKRAEAPGSHTIAEWKSVLRHFGRKCVYCNTKLTRYNVSRDHVTPLSRGGTNDIRNIVPACRKCNVRKHTRTPEEFRKVLQHKDLSVSGLH